MIARKIQNNVLESIKYFPVVGIIGPRQVGKTTLVKQLIKHINKTVIYLDLELHSDLFKLQEPEFFLSQQAGKLVIIDEIQIKKDLFPLLRALVDRTREPGQFVILGSASPDLIRDSSESLAGRISYHQLHPFNISEIPEKLSTLDLWMKGGFPDALLAPNSELMRKWMSNFIDTYLNRDLRQLGLKTSSQTIWKLWHMLAHINGQVLNTSNLAKSLEVTSPSVQRYIDFLEEAFLVKTLQPYSWNINKRLVKSPKIYLTDTGILHQLLGINDINELMGHPAIGNSWEAFVINQILSTKKPSLDIGFFRTHQGAEVDVVIAKGLKVLACAEIKYSNNPKISKGNIQAFKDLNAPVNFVITPSSANFYLKENIMVTSVKHFIIEILPHIS